MCQIWVNSTNKSGSKGIFNQAGRDKSSGVKYFRLVQNLSCEPDRYESNTVRLKELSGWQKDKVLQWSKE